MAILNCPKIKNEGVKLVARIRTSGNVALKTAYELSLRIFNSLWVIIYIGGGHSRPFLIREKKTSWRPNNGATSQGLNQRRKKNQKCLPVSKIFKRRAIKMIERKQYVAQTLQENFRSFFTASGI